MKLFFEEVLLLDTSMMFALLITASILISRAKNTKIYFSFGLANVALLTWMFMSFSDYFRATQFSLNFHARLVFLSMKLKLK